MKVAIVGSEEKRWVHEDKLKVISDIIEILSQPDTELVSGGCPYGGPDIWAEVIATTLGLKQTIFLPDVNVWSVRGSDRKGYKERNIQIASTCDTLHCFTPLSNDWSGAIWTARYAESLQKPVFYHSI